jgi:hypothetical protein
VDADLWEIGVGAEEIGGVKRRDKMGRHASASWRRVGGMFGGRLMLGWVSLRKKDLTWTKSGNYWPKGVGLVWDWTIR